MSMYKQGNFEFINLSKNKVKSIVKKGTDLPLIIVNSFIDNNIARKEIINQKDFKTKTNTDSKLLNTFLGNYSKNEIKLANKLIYIEI